MTDPEKHDRPERCVIVVDRTLPPGLAANAAAVLAISLGSRSPQLPGRDLVDADGTVHPGLIPMGLPVLSAPPEDLGAVRAAALDADLDVVAFPAAGQRTTDYETFAAHVARTPTGDLAYIAVALCGPGRPVRRITGGFPLLR